MKWQYKIINPDNNFVPESLMNVMGLEGWELVTVDNGVAYFKRPVQDTVLGHKIVVDDTVENWQLIHQR